MKTLQNFIKDETGVLSFEWIVIITVLVIGIVGGMTAVRDALIIVYSGTASAASHLDQSFGDPTIPVGDSKPADTEYLYGSYKSTTPHEYVGTSRPSSDITWPPPDKIE